MRFDKKPFFNEILGLRPNWDYKPKSEYISWSEININTIDKIHLNCDCIDGQTLNGKGQPTSNSFALDKRPGIKIFCQPETKQYKKSVNLFWLL